MVRGAQFRAEHLSVPTLQLVGRLDPADVSMPRIWALAWPFGKVSSRGTFLSRMTQVQRRGAISEVAQVLQMAFFGFQF